MVTLAGGLVDTGFIQWLAKSLSPAFERLGPSMAIVALVGAYYFLHYFFASITAHSASMLPIFLAVALTIPAVSPKEWGLLLAYPLGLMGILTTYTAGHSPIYYGSGYISRRAFWGLGFGVGAFFLIVYLAIAVPWLAHLQRSVRP